MADWISVNERLPPSGKVVLCYFVDRDNFRPHGAVARAFYAAPKTIETSPEEYQFEYDEELDKFFLPEGWYEFNQFDDYNYRIWCEVTHWMPLPRPPKESIK